MEVKFRLGEKSHEYIGINNFPDQLPNLSSLPLLPTLPPKPKKSDEEDAINCLEKLRGSATDIQIPKIDSILGSSSSLLSNSMMLPPILPMQQQPMLSPLMPQMQLSVSQADMHANLPYSPRPIEVCTYANVD